MKPIKTEINFEKRTDDAFVLTQLSVDEATRKDMETMIPNQLKMQKSQIEKELSMNEEASKALNELNSLPVLKKLIGDRLNIRVFSAEEIDLKNNQIKLLDENLAKIAKILG